MSISDLVKNHEKKIKECLEVDPDIFYGDKAEVEMLKYVNKELWQEKKENARGFFNPKEYSGKDNDEVYIFVKDEREKIGTLAHELRHASQYNLKFEEFEFPTDPYCLNDSFYSCRKAEIDANKYAYKYCKKQRLGFPIMFYYAEKVIYGNLIRFCHKVTCNHSCP